MKNFSLNKKLDTSLERSNLEELDERENLIACHTSIKIPKKISFLDKDRKPKSIIGKTGAHEVPEVPKEWKKCDRNKSTTSTKKVKKFIKI